MQIIIFDAMPIDAFLAVFLVFGAFSTRHLLGPTTSEAKWEGNQPSTGYYCEPQASSYV